LESTWTKITPSKVRTRPGEDKNENKKGKIKIIREKNEIEKR